MQAPLLDVMGDTLVERDSESTQMVSRASDDATEHDPALGVSKWTFCRGPPRWH